MTQKGRLYGVGVGPGDPELLTVKAVRLLKACDVIAIPQKDSEKCVALKIAAGAAPEALAKPILALDMPMIRDRKLRERAYAEAAERIQALLAEGKTVVFLTLGDPSIYSTYGYLHSLVHEAGYEATFVPGVTSFCAAAAALGEPLCEDGEGLHILPGNASVSAGLGTRVFMKGGVPEVRRMLKDHDGPVLGASNVGMDHERLYGSLAQIPEDAGYFTLIIAKEKRQ